MLRRIVDYKDNQEVLHKVYGKECGIDASQKAVTKISQLFEKNKNPRLCKIDDYEVELEWSDTKKTMQDCLHDMFASC